MRRLKYYLVAAFAVVIFTLMLNNPTKVFAGGWGGTVVLRYQTLDGKYLNVINETGLESIIVTPENEELEAKPIWYLHEGWNEFDEKVDSYGPEVFIHKRDELFNAYIVPGRYFAKDFTFPAGYELDDTWGTGEGTEYPLYVDISEEEAASFALTGLEEAGHEDFIIVIPVKKIGEASLAKTVPAIKFSTEDYSLMASHYDFPSGTDFHYEYSISKDGDYTSIGDTNNYLSLRRYSELKAGKTYYFRCRISVVINGEEKYFDYSEPIEVKMPGGVVKPTKTAFSSVVGSKKAIKLKWKKQTKNVDGYQIRYSKYSNMKSAKSSKIKNNSKTSTTIKGLSAKKKYYVQIRTYKNVDGKTYYSDWSKAKKVTTK